MNKSTAIEALKKYTERLVALSEEKITAGEQIYDTMGDIESYGEQVEGPWEEEYANVVADIEEAPDEEFFEFLKEASKAFYGALPCCIIGSLRKREAADAIIAEWLKNPILQKDINSSTLTHEEVEATDDASFAIFIAGKKQSEKVFEALAETFKNCLTTNEMFLESIITAMSSEAAVPQIMALLKDDDLNFSKKADAMQMMCNTGVKNDEIYREMKRNFKLLCKDPSKEIVGAMLMFDYGDTRIVTALRKLVMDKIEAGSDNPKEDNTNIYILLSMINKLGGNTKDMTGGKNLFET